MLLIYTGNGKGKTTAALGMALRAAGWGKKISILQFVKQESWPEGARLSIRNKLADNIEIKALGSGFVGIMGDTKPRQVHVARAHQAVQTALEKITSDSFDLIILDELLGSLKGKLITKLDVQKILGALKSHPKTDLVLTGRHAPKWLVDQADLVSEVKEVKHPFQKGIQAKKGIDY